MGMQFEHAFVVKAPADRVWAYLTDPQRVAPALPGASITEKVDDRTWAGGITVKVGPVSAKYRGTVAFESLDAAARTAEIVARGQDTSGRGGADMRIKSRIAERAGGESEVTVVSDVTVTGVMAQFGRGLMQDVSNQMLERFTEAMRAELEKPEAAGTAPAGAGVAAAPSAPPPSAPPLELSSVVLRQPAFWVVVLVVAATVVWLLAR
jgi:carbon monoxide dehydrogenase subunit G